MYVSEILLASAKKALSAEFIDQDDFQQICHQLVLLVMQATGLDLKHSTFVSRVTCQIWRAARTGVKYVVKGSGKRWRMTVFAPCKHVLDMEPTPTVVHLMR